MILNLILIGGTVTLFVALGIMWILFPRAVMKWGGTTLLPLFFWPITRISQILRMEIKPINLSELSPRLILITRLLGVWFIVVSLIFLAAVLGFFK